ncbi:MAG: galactokinase [Anaerolineales bacterium]
MKAAGSLADRVTEAFRREYGRSPLAIARAPGRVNLIGEHVDYNDGWVLPAAIDRGAFLAFSPLPTDGLQVLALDLGERLALGAGELPGPEASWTLPAWARYPVGVAWALRQAGLSVRGLRGVITSSVPVGAGLSSSAALEVSFAIAWESLGGWSLERMKLAQLCQQAENDYVGMHCGLMDQFASLHGRAGSAVLLDCRTLAWEPVAIPPSLGIVIADTGVRRSLSASAYNERRDQCERAVALLAESLPGIRALRDVRADDFEKYAHLLPPEVQARARHVIYECQRTRRAAQALQDGDLRVVGGLVNASHESLRDLYGVSGPELDAMVSCARNLEGCYGARLTGAGFGGCTVNLVERQRLEGFPHQLSEAYHRATGLEAHTMISQPASGASLIAEGGPAEAR